MARILKSLLLVIAVGTLAACSQDCDNDAGCPRTAPAHGQERPQDRADAPSTGVSKAETFFAMYLKDPSNEGSWRWLCRSAANGYAPAQYALAVRYRDGSSTQAPNPVRAHAWFTQAQRNGLSAAAIAREELAKTMSDKQLAWAGKLRKFLSEADCNNP